MYNYFVDGQGFKTYEDARDYADTLFFIDRIFKCVYTRAEIESMLNEGVTSC